MLQLPALTRLPGSGEDTRGGWSRDSYEGAELVEKRERKVRNSSVMGASWDSGIHSSLQHIFINVLIPGLIES